MVLSDASGGNVIDTISPLALLLQPLTARHRDQNDSACFVNLLKEFIFYRVAYMLVLNIRIGSFGDRMLKESH